MTRSFYVYPWFALPSKPCVGDVWTDAKCYFLVLESEPFLSLPGVLHFRILWDSGRTDWYAWEEWIGNLAERDGKDGKLIFQKIGE